MKTHQHYTAGIVMTPGTYTAYIARLTQNCIAKSGKSYTLLELAIPEKVYIHRVYITTDPRYRGSQLRAFALATGLNLTTYSHLLDLFHTKQQFTITLERDDAGFHLIRK